MAQSYCVCFIHALASSIRNSILTEIYDKTKYIDFETRCKMSNIEQIMTEDFETYRLKLINPKTQHRSTTRDQLVVSGYWETRR